MNLDNKVARVRILTVTLANSCVFYAIVINSKHQLYANFYYGLCALKSLANYENGVKKKFYTLLKKHKFKVDHSGLS